MNPKFPLENFFDQKRNELLAAFFSEDFSAFIRIYNQILDQIVKRDHFKENEHKAINQIRLFLLKFQNKTSDCKQKGLHREFRKQISQQVRQETKNISYTGFSQWQDKTGFDDALCKLIFQTAIILQITTGCSNYCRRCNEWAIPGVRTHFSFQAIKIFSKRIFKTGNDEFIYYGASDPLDWQDGNHDISDIIHFLKLKNYTLSYGLLTKLPSGKNRILEKLIREKADLSISVTNKNRKRIEAFEKKIGKSLNKQHDLDDLLIPAGLDEDFSSVKSSITDSYGTEITPDGAFMVIPTFTSALNLTGQHRIPITGEAEYLITRKTGRKALPVEYFKPFEALDLKGRRIRLKKLLDVQIENIILDNGDEKTNPPGMMNLDEFFKTFESEAVLRKKNILPTIIKKYKKKYLHNQKFKDADKSQKKIFKEKLTNYLTLCNRDKMQYLKKFAFSYFLSAVSGYLRNNPSKHRIIIHLKKNDQKKLKKDYPEFFSSKKIDSFFNSSRPDSFIIFQILIFRLLDSPDEVFIHNFIDEYPAVYNEFADMFIPQNSPAS